MSSTSPSSSLVEENAASARLVFDASDLMAYFPFNRSPTGIQRVQIEIIGSLLTGRSDTRPSLVRFSERTNQWHEIPASLFLDLIAASSFGNDPLDPTWLALFRRVDAASSSIPFRWITETTFVNLGSSWWLPNYFLHVRHLQQTVGIDFVPLVYDLIPAMAPSFCLPALVTGFIDWLVALLAHADRYVAISEASKADLLSLAARMGHDIAPSSVAVLPLDADFRSGNSIAEADGDLPANVAGHPYVLLVSTLEVRKNQLAALEAWRTLINRHGADRIPTLVMVGKLGYHGTLIANRLDMDEALAARVVILPKVDDTMLARLYRSALFTLYPSSYEGWGLPVTESLCYGKVPLVADNSSLPEAGGRFARYFSTGSPSSLLAGLEALIFDASGRQADERRIKESFVPRPWSVVAAQLMADILMLRDHAGSRRDQSAGAVGSYYPMKRNSAMELWPQMGSAERFRSGTGWYELTDAGSYTRPEGGNLSIPLAPTDGALVALELVGLPTIATRYVVSNGGGVPLAEGDIEPLARRWVTVEASAASGRVALMLRSATTEDEPADEHTPGRLRRPLGVGLAGIFLLPLTPEGRMTLVESLALGNLNDYSAFRRRS